MAVFLLWVPLWQSTHLASFVISVQRCTYINVLKCSKLNKTWLMWALFLSYFLSSCFFFVFLFDFGSCVFPFRLKRFALIEVFNVVFKSQTKASHMRKKEMNDETKSTLNKELWKIWDSMWRGLLASCVAVSIRRRWESKTNDAQEFRIERKKIKEKRKIRFILCYKIHTLKTETFRFRIVLVLNA